MTHIVKLPRDKKINIELVGVGGTGSMLLPHLARIHFAITALGGKGLHVTTHDPDTVSQANIGRQNFIHADVGANKATLLTSRINSMFGVAWSANPEFFTKPSYDTNIIISCVDNVKSRKQILESTKNTLRHSYWIDCGNDQHSGQVIIGSIAQGDIKQGLTELNENNHPYLPNVLDLFPNMEEFEEDSGPSCSLAEALQSQDLMINPTIALQCANALYQMIRNHSITHHAWFIDTKRGASSPLKIDGKVWDRMGVQAHSSS